MHDLMKEPTYCAECRGRRAESGDRPALQEHFTAQDRAIAQAVREAAGEENPIKWLLPDSEPTRGVLWDMFGRIDTALRRIVGQS